MSGEPRERLGSITRRIGTLEHFGWLERIIRWIVVLNVLDAIITLYWVETRQATEANPVLFVVVKVGMVALGTALLWRLRKRRTAVVGIFVAFLVYYFVLLYHLRAADLRLLERLWS
jgi:hypothetical protein